VQPEKGGATVEVSGFVPLARAGKGSFSADGRPKADGSQPPRAKARNSEEPRFPLAASENE